MSAARRVQRRAGAVVAVAGVLVALAGCGTQSAASADGAYGPIGVRGVWAPAASGAAGENGATSGSPSAGGGATRASSAAGDIVVKPGQSKVFTTPTRNIACSIESQLVRCDIQKKTWQVPAPPATCSAAQYGNGIQVAATGEAGLTCTTDTLLGDASTTVLAYGHTATADVMQCSSSQDGVRCRNTATGRGFTLAIATYTVF